MLNFKLNFKIKNIILSVITLPAIALSQVQAAAVIEPSTQPPNVLAPYAVSSTDLDGGTAKAYRPWFENGAFTGDLIEYDISAAGDLSTDIVFPTADTAASSPGSNWSARVQFDAKGSTYWTDTRKVIFHNGTAQKAFLWDNLSGSQQTAMGNSDKLDYSRGDQSNEKPSGTLRTRISLLSDIIHSNPVYIAAPDAKFTLPDYADFRTAKTSRSARVYVGSNGGMLHAFEATGANAGDEVYAYIPSMLIDKLSNLTVDPLTHSYYVDGQLAEGDAYFVLGADPIAWHSLLVGGLGSGAKGIFALNITNPDLSSETSTDDADQKILWEIDGSDTDMGYIHGKSQVARLPEEHSNEWVVITGNGYSSGSGRAKLLTISMDGTVNGVYAGTETSNGLSAPTLIDIDGDFDVDIGFAGDLQGDLWKFDFRGSGGTISATRIFEGSVDKPITSAPEVRSHPTRGYIVYFGTGSLLSDDDATNTSTRQSVYGIWDEAPAGATLLTQTLAKATYVATDGTERFTRIVTDNAINWANNYGWEVELAIDGERVVTKSFMRANRLQFVTHVSDSTLNGESWLIQLNYLNGGTGPSIFLDVNNDGGLDIDDKTTEGNIPVGLYLGEGSFSEPTITRIDVDDDATFINALIFDIETRTACVTDCGDGFLLGHIDVDTDSPLGPHKATRADDYRCYPDGIRPTYVSGTSGALTTPTSVATRDEDDELSNWLDVDGLGGEVDGHAHEYDKLHGQVYVDYVNLEPRCAQSKSVGSGTNSTQKLERISEVEMPSNEKFFAIIANADLSPYSTFKLNTIEWNVMEYQKMVQIKLDAWILAGENETGTYSFEAMMKDDNNNPLLHKYDDFFNADGVLTGTVRHSFNDEAIADGGLLSTKYSCVTNDAERNFSESTSDVETCTGSWWRGTRVCTTETVTTYNTGRWRGGALVTQLVGVTDYLADITRVIKQTPSDLYRERTYKDANDNDVTVILKNATNSYGGLRLRNKNDDGSALATANPAFLYEASIYWHNPDDICYGDSNWLTDLSSIDENSSNDVIENFSDTIASLEYDIEQADVRLQELLAIPEADRTDEEKQEIRNKQKIIELLNLKIDSLRNKAVVLIDVSTVKTKEEIDLNLSPSLGPNFRTGRRTWIDLTP